jgi:hypothetical protein
VPSACLSVQGTVGGVRVPPVGGTCWGADTSNLGVATVHRGDDRGNDGDQFSTPSPCSMRGGELRAGGQGMPGRQS